jgi:hypothetical protein
MKYILVFVGYFFSFALDAQVDLAFYQVYNRIGNSVYYPAGLEYYTIPENQIAPIRLSAQVSNISGNIATNSYLKVDVYEDGLLDTTFFSDSLDICAYCVDSLFITSSYLPIGGTNYTFNYFVYTDQPESNLANNGYTRELDIDYNPWSAYRRDNGQYITNISDNPLYPGELAEFGNVFEIFANDIICGASIYITPAASNVGDMVYATAYRIDTVSGEFWFQNYSNDYEITSNDLGEYITVYFYNMEVDSGDVISVMAGHYGYDMMTQFGQSQMADFGSVIGFCFGSIFVPANYRTIMVYPIFYEGVDCGVGIDEKTIADFIFFPAFPNPASEQSTLHYKLQQNSNVNLYLTDLNGKIIEQIVDGEQVFGEHSIILDLNKFEAGIYFLTLQTEYGTQTQCLVKN